jgi:hypothetical protein
MSKQVDITGNFFLFPGKFLCKEIIFLLYFPAKFFRELAMKL